MGPHVQALSSLFALAAGRDGGDRARAAAAADPRAVPALVAVLLSQHPAPLHGLPGSATGPPIAALAVHTGTLLRRCAHLSYGMKCNSCLYWNRL